MVSVSGRFINWYFTRVGFKRGMVKDLARGNRRAAAPSAKVKAANAVTAPLFQGRKLWHIHPKSGHPKSGHPESGELTDPKTIVLFFHGGGYFYDVIKEHFPVWARIANLSGALVILPSYPLAGQASATEITDFSIAAYLDIKQRYPKAKIIIGGDSAGGGLALQVCQRLNSLGQNLPEHMLLWSPWADISHDRASLVEQDKRSVIIGLEGVKKAADLYRGNLDAKDPRVSPFYGDLSALPPMSVVTGSRDLLHLDILSFSKAAKTAGAKLDLDIWPGQNHYFMYLPQAEAKKIARQTARLIRSI